MVAIKVNMTDYNKKRSEKLLSSLNLDDGREPVYTIKKSKTPWITIIVSSAIVIVFMIFNFNVTLTRIDGHSMDPTLHTGQIVLVKRHEKVKRFDVATFTERITDDGDAKQIVKRIIGMPGDVITVINGDLYINDKRYDEPYLKSELIKTYKKSSYTITVPKNHYFVLGDNRDVSKDSRSVGCFEARALDGVVILKGKK